MLRKVFLEQPYPDRRLGARLNDTCPSLADLRGLRREYMPSWVKGARKPEKKGIHQKAILIRSNKYPPPVKPDEITTFQETLDKKALCSTLQKKWMPGKFVKLEVFKFCDGVIDITYSGPDVEKWCRNTAVHDLLVYISFYRHLARDRILYARPQKKINQSSAPRLSPGKTSTPTGRISERPRHLPGSNQTTRMWHLIRSQNGTCRYRRCPSRLRGLRRLS